MSEKERKMVGDDKIVTYMGQRIDQMNREDLISVINELGRQLRRANESHMHALKTWADIAKSRAYV